MRKFALPGIGAAVIAVAPLLALPGTNPAYFGGETVTVNAIEVKRNEHALEQASAELYVVVYPGRAGGHSI
jgi:hypothetical protein